MIDRHNALQVCLESIAKRQIASWSSQEIVGEIPISLDDQQLCASITSSILPSRIGPS